MNLKKLAEPFKYDDLEFRISRAGANNGKVWAVALTYITARAIHDRLDEVCGPDKWQLRYKEHLGGTVCEIGILIGEEWVWKAGGSDNTQIEAFKGGLSGAEKRAGVPWGIGRYLYKLARYPDLYVDTTTTKKNEWNYQGENKRNNVPKFWWCNPKMPADLLPAEKTNPNATAQGSPSTADLAYKLDVALTEKDMTDNEKIQIVKFYCKSKKISLVELHELPADHLQNFINKIDDVFDAFLSAQC